MTTAKENTCCVYNVPRPQHCFPFLCLISKEESRPGDRSHVPDQISRRPDSLPPPQHSGQTPAGFRHTNQPLPV
ncbi:hypothetical protein N658DRAFT_491954 [Parathielavia hyrcaniae]|uniref:Uncharacterized protein n=1 Tax=Parathielavia hyrcaniae TaxID=113614 RepID=A0AAN6T5H3_9PEZI|nr:hypothetical protein N658DRAFT_491954 [Parathielavia hyrcaniae]